MQSLLQSYINKISNKFRGVVHLRASGKKKGDVLISYITEPFTIKPGNNFPNLHTNYWECYEIARLFSIRGYSVDIINWDNYNFIPRKNYRVCIDTQNNLEHLVKFLPKDCGKVLHIVTSHGDFQNNAEIKRLEELKIRRGIILAPHRQMFPTRNLEYADFLEGFGNNFVHSTYSNSNKPIFPIPISVVKTFDFPEKKDFDLARRNFLWFGGGGVVLKGLDLVLEAFVANPHLELHVCGPVVAEKDFFLAFRKELCETKNIHIHGRIDVAGKLFREIIDKCGALIYPAFSEGTSGAVVQVMHTGIIPITTPQSGIYEDAGVIIIENPTVESVSQSINSFSNLPPERIRDMAHSIWTYSRSKYTREEFSKKYSEFIDSILKP